MRLYFRNKVTGAIKTVDDGDLAAIDALKAARQDPPNSQRTLWEQTSSADATSEDEVGEVTETPITPTVLTIGRASQEPEPDLIIPATFNAYSSVEDGNDDYFQPRVVRVGEVVTLRGMLRFSAPPTEGQMKAFTLPDDLLPVNNVLFLCSGYKTDSGVSPMIQVQVYGSSQPSNAIYRKGMVTIIWHTPNDPVAPTGPNGYKDFAEWDEVYFDSCTWLRGV